MKIKELAKGVGFTAAAGVTLGVGVAATIVEGPMGKMCNHLGRKSPIEEQMEGAKDFWKEAKKHFNNM